MTKLPKYPDGFDLDKVVAALVQLRSKGFLYEEIKLLAYKNQNPDDLKSRCNTAVIGTICDWLEDKEQEKPKRKQRR